LNFPKGTLFNRVSEVDPLVCPKCNGQMRIIAFIEEEEIIKKVLAHLGLHPVKSKPPPRALPNLHYSRIPRNS
jgi:hypothetical protein